MFLSILGFLIILGPLVVFHEFGHYFFARLFNVKAEIFSVGFGPRLWSKQLGETELRVSLVPLGGYVKLLGEDRDADLSPADLGRSLQRQAAWKRFLIFFGGPLFNFIFAILIFMVILVVGEPQLASVAGRVVPGTEAARAGFVSGDRILSVNHKPVKLFEEFANIVSDNPGKVLSFEVLHLGATQPVVLAAIPTSEKGFSIYGEVTPVGEIDGLFPNGRSTQLGVSDPGSEASHLGLRTGDQIVEFNGKPVQSWEEIEHLYQSLALAPGSNTGLPFSLKLKHGTSDETRTVVFTKKRDSGKREFGTDWGFYSSELFVDKVVPGSPAQAAGIKPGDRMVAVGNHNVESFFGLKDAVQSEGEATGKIPLKWEHQGHVTSAVITPSAKNVRDPLLKKTTQFTVGIMPLLELAPADQVIERVFNPFTLLYRGTARMLDLTYRNFVTIRKMFTGDVSVATLGGPIMISKIAGESLAHGLVAFLTTMGLLSIGLGVLNVLPVPVLDGGHLLLLLIEGIRRKPLTMRQMEVVQQVGLSLLLILMVIVIKNDITRLPFFD